MGTIDEKNFYRICNYLNDRCLEFERNEETPFEFYFALSSGMNMYASGIYTNVGRHEKETGKFVNKINKILYFRPRFLKEIHSPVRLCEILQSM